MHRQEAPEHDASTAKSRSGYVISLHGCPLIWHSKLQPQVVLCTTKAEHRVITIIPQRHNSNNHAPIAKTER